MLHQPLLISSVSSIADAELHAPAVDPCHLGLVCPGPLGEDHLDGTAPMKVALVAKSVAKTGNQYTGLN